TAEVVFYGASMLMQRSDAVLLALPVGTTVGVLLGLDSHRQSQGQAPLFNGENGRGGGAGGGSSRDNRVTNSQYCQKQVGISPASTGVQYICKHTLRGRRAGSRIGHRWTLVTTFHNGTYATKTSAPSFSVTWQYPPAAAVQPVHAFPNIQLDGAVLPMSLQNLQNINLELRWTYGVGNEPVATTDVAGLATNLANTNV
ncbi:glycoside hydrolase family 12 protein, partial [Diplocarpon rosae]